MEWKEKISSFKQIDVRGIQGNFFQGLKKQAMQLPAGEGLEIVQSFEPIPLYEVMEGLDFEHFTEKKGDAEYHAYFYRHLPYEMRLLLSLTNAVGAGRMRQATRELVKAYIHGLDSAALDDVFELLAWNQGIGYFSSEIGPSTLFAAYKTIKNMEKQEKPRGEICEVLKEKFGEKNPDVKV